MNREIVLEPSGSLPDWQQQVEALPLSPEIKHELLSTRLTSILISTQPPLMVLRVQAERLLPRKAWEHLAQGVLQQLDNPADLKVVVDATYPNGVVGLSAYVETHWTDLLALFSRQVPLAGVYLSMVRFTTVEDRRLRVQVPHELSVAALRRQGGEKLLGQLLSERLGRAVTALFELGDFGEEVKEREALYQRRLREELERLQQENDPSVGATAPGAKAAVWKLLLGRKLTAPPIPIVSVQEEQESVVFEGEVTAFECKVLRTGRQLVLMDIYDKTGSINARFFADAGKQVAPELKAGAYVRVRGTVQHDKYSQDLCLSINDLALGERPRRQDLAVEKRIELHAHTQMSAMDGLADVERLVAQAASFGHAAIAITDHGGVQSYPQAMAAGAKHKIKVLYGMEGYLVEDDWGQDKHRRPYHICLMIAEPQGVKNLYRLISETHLKHFYRQPRIPRSLLAQYRDGLLLGTACEQGELFRRLREGAEPAELEAIAQRYDYLEIMPRANNQFLLREGHLASEADLLALNQRIVALGERLGLPVVASGDVHFLEPGDEIFRSILQSGMGYEDAAQQAPLYFKTTDEMLAEFAYLGEAQARAVVIENPRRLAERIGNIVPLKSEFFPPHLPNAEEDLERLALTHAQEVYGTPLPKAVAQRLVREISGITANRFASLFMIARRLVQKSMEDGYLVGSRGSVGSSLTATMLGITEVNPLPGHYRCPQCHHFELDPVHRIGADLPDRACPTCSTLLEKDGFDIPFEVFMGFKGNKLPDIDLNFSGEYQAQAHKYLETIFDRDHIFRAGTISTVADRIAFGFVKKYLEENKLVLRDAEVNRLTRGCAGVKKTTGQHPGGIMIVPQDMDIYDFTPVQRPADDDRSEIVTTHFDYHAIHDALLKLDILGHDDPTSLRRLSDLTGLDVRSIPLDDPDTLKIFSGLTTLGVDEAAIGTPIGTLGIPEFGTEFVRQMLEVTRPTTFAELVRISGLSHGTDVWLNNAADLIKAKTATLSTVISARDDIMNYLIQRQVDPALAFEIMESVRKGKGLSAAHEELMKTQGVPDWYIQSCKKIKYMFPKAHAVAYCLMAFRIAYFKVHFPAAFYANYFSLNAEFFDAELVVNGGLHKVVAQIAAFGSSQELTAKEKNQGVILEVVREAFARGIRFKPVSLLGSDPRVFRLVGENELQPPLIALAGLGMTCAERITEERQARPFRSVEDLSRRTGANRNVVEILTQHGCLDLPRADQTSLFESPVAGTTTSSSSRR